jgi:hypothetical protein
MPTSSHLFYIPLILLIGIIIGVMLGRRSVAVQQAEAERRRRLEEARAERKARKEPGRDDPGTPSEAPVPPDAA